MNPKIVVGVLAVMVVLRVLRAGLLAWIAAWWLGLYAVLRYGFTTPIPASEIHTYMSIVSLALFAYATSSRERAEAAFGPIFRFATESRFTLALSAAVVAIPCLVAWGVYRDLQQPIQAPFFGRTVHPSPPTEITVHGEKVNLVTGSNPLRALEKSDPAAFRKHVESGRTTYYQNCFFCHGDSLGGDGMYAHGLNPVPANFQDSGVLPNFQETFFFWRVAKGGPGMPDEGGPGDSAMPEWERFLSNEQIWEVILFLYDDTGYRPRTFEEAAPSGEHK